MKKSILLFMLLALAFSSCTRKPWKKTDNGVIINNGEKAIALEVIRPWIIHVFASEDLVVPEKKSLIIQDECKPEGSWNIIDAGDAVRLETDSLTVIVDKVSLGLKFLDASGNLVLAEPVGGGKSFTRDSIDGEPVLTVQQVFAAGDEEAFFGLGQHQDRRLNLRGGTLSFNQRNREIFVPFLVSSGGYGILWDNYSWTRFGSLEPSQKITESLFFDKSGTFGGLSTEFFSDPEMKKRIAAGITQSVPFEFPGELSDAIMAARYQGEVEIPESGVYTFENRGKQYFRMWLDGQLVRDYWSSFVLATDYTRLELEKGKHALKIEWSRSAANETMELYWRTPAMKDDSISLWSQAGKGIDYYFVFGPALDGVVAGYRELTGRSPMLPKWAYGFWQSRERYQTQEELVSTVREFRKRKVPMDVIVQDWQYWQSGNWGSHEFDPARFPDPKAAFDSIHALNARVMISVWPKFYSTVRNFRELNDKGFIYPGNLRDSTRDWLGYVSVYYDAYNPAARELYWSQINKTLVPAGVDAWWMDASEPEVISDASPAEMARRMTPNYFGTGLEFLNAYSLFNSKGIYENQRKVRPEDRVCILTRSGFAGQQKYAAVSWSGDITSRWDVLKAQIPAGLSFSISGIPYWTTDIGAFSVDFPGGNTNAQYRELFVRWYQFGTFCPVFRVHGSDTPREIWYFGDENDPEYSIQLKFSRLRYRLLPYIYALAGKVNLEHYTLMRPLVMDFPLDPIGWNTDDQYMFGTAFMVCPVTEKGSVDRPVYLPDGGWYDFWYGHYLEGGHSISASAPITTMPLFVREGSVVPLGPDLQYTNEKLPDTIRLLIYTGKSGSFDLYEDDGISNACEDGAYTVIPIRWDEEKRSLQIGKQEGDYKDKIKKRVFEISWITREKPVGYNELPDPDERVVYNGSGVRITMK